ncbi:MAG: aldolase/citrate lyase family protein [Alphaproteobacteria bacterium]
MNLPRNVFKSRLPMSAPLIGSWLMSASPLTAEAMGCVGFDFLVVDMEHCPIDLPQALALMQVLAGTPTPPVLRVPWNDAIIVKRVLDAGAQTLMFPFIQTIEEAKQAVAATRYPPRGIRGVAGMNRAGRFGTITDYVHKAASELCVILQLETPAAVALLPQIAALDGVDAIFIGPADLSANMGLLGKVMDPQVQEALAAAAQVAKDCKVPCGIIGQDTAAVKRYLAMGYSFVAMGSDLGLMIHQASSGLETIRKDLTTPTSSPS